MKKYLMFLLCLFLIGCDNSTSTNAETSVELTTLEEISSTTIPITTTEKITTTFPDDPLRELVEGRIEEFFRNLPNQDKFTFNSSIDYLICFNDTPSKVYSSESIKSKSILDATQGYLLADFFSTENRDYNFHTVISNQDNKLVMNEATSKGYTQDILGENLSAGETKEIMTQLVANQMAYVAYFPEFAVMTEVSADKYFYEFSVADFIKYDKAFATSLGFYPLFDSSQTPMVTISIDFSLGDYTYEISHDRYAIGEQNEFSTYYLDVNLKDDVNINYVESYDYLNRETTGFILFQNPEDCIYTYKADENFCGSIVEGEEGYFKFYLQEGYYYSPKGIDLYDGLKHVTLLDEDLNEVPIDYVFYLEDSGTYYVKFSHDYNDNGSLYGSFESIDLSDPSINVSPEANLLDRLTEDETHTFVLANKPGEYKLLSIIVNEDSDYVNLKYRGTGRYLGEGDTLYFIIKPNELFLLDLFTEYSHCDYDISWELTDITAASENVSEMEEMELGQCKGIVITAPDYIGYMKFTITRPANYVFSVDLHHFTGQAQSFQLYDEAGNLIQSIGDHDTLSLAAGTYYLKIIMFTQEDSIIAMTVHQQ